MSADLISRLEKAEEGSRELDALIHCSGFSDHHNDEMSCRGCGCAPRYTTSVDMALRVIPEGTEFEICFMTHPFGSTTKRHMCILWPTQPPRQVTVIGPSAPLAIVIAALKARSMGNG